MVGVTYHHTKGHTMNSYLIHQMAQARQADLLREAAEYRRAGLTAGPTVLSRVTARIPRFTAGTGRSRERVVAPSTPGGDARGHLPVRGHAAASVPSPARDDRSSSAPNASAHSAVLMSWSSGAETPGTGPAVQLRV
jgi:hypothetical protein